MSTRLSAIGIQARDFCRESKPDFFACLEREGRVEEHFLAVEAGVAIWDQVVGTALAAGDESGRAEAKALECVKAEVFS